MEIPDAHTVVALNLGLGVEKRGTGFDKAALISRVNELILHDFEKLVSILYRLDVSEQKINSLLGSFPETDAAEMITALMLERELEKQKTRESFRQKGTTTDDMGEERW
jgi:hypothetical protein